MSYQEWQARSIQFLTEMAMGEPTWITYDSSDETDRTFLIGDITRALYGVKTLDNQEQDLVQDIVEICSNEKCKLRLRVLHLGIVYCCVRITKTGAKYVVPLFRVRNSSKDPEFCCIIDHFGNDYEDLNVYLQHNTWPNCWLMVPEKLQYKLENGVCKTVVYDMNASKVTNFTEPAGPTEEIILESISKLREDEDNGITLLKDCLDQVHHAKFDATRCAYREVVQPGLMLESCGDRKFLRDMKSCEDLNRFYGNFIMTEDGMFVINGQMTIHPRAFFQMPGRVRKAIIDGMRKINESSAEEEEKAMEFYENELGKSDPDKLYRHNELDKESIHDEQQLLSPSKFDVKSLKDISIGGKRIFADLKPFEVRRLYKVLQNLTRKSIELVIKFAAEINVEDFVDFCAAAEYSHKAVSKEFKQKRKGYRVATGISKKEWEESLKNGIINEFQTHKLSELVESFRDIMAQCDRAFNSDGPKFHSLIAAANHVDRHAKDFSKDPSKAVATYLSLAQQMVTSHYSELQWTQDGSKVCCTYLCEEHSARAIKYVSYPEKSGTIATLIKEKRMRNVIENRYYYHPDY